MFGWDKDDADKASLWKRLTNFSSLAKSPLNTFTATLRSRIVSKAKTQTNEETLKIRNRNDCWLPEGYSKYELLVNNPKLLLKEIKNDPFAGNLPEFKLKNIQQKSYESDIFFTRPATKKECSYNKTP